MKVLAINFGHDASLALFDGQKLLSFLELERVTRLKHTVGVGREDIVDFLSQNALAWGDLDFVALTGTQWYKAKHNEQILIKESNHMPDFSADIIIRHGLEVGGTDKWYDYSHHQARLEPVEQTAFPLDAVMEGEKELKSFSAADFQAEAFRSVYPYSIEIAGEKKPASFVPHQLAHASYGAFYRESAANCQLILSHDGGWPHIPFNSGGIFLFKDQQLFPLLDPRLFLGQLYQIMGERAGFRPSEAPGKLMGLASYGIPDSVGLEELKEQYNKLAADCTQVSAEAFHERFASLCDAIEKQAGQVYLRHEVECFEFDFEDKRQSIGIAAYTQKLVEQVWSASLSGVLESLVDRFQVKGSLAVVGGFSLNCPSNSLLQANLTSLRVKPLPGGSDMGVSIGAGALMASFLTGSFPINDLESPLSPAFPPRPSQHKLNPPLGMEKINVGNPLAFYAQQLQQGKVFCHVEGQSEVGPRALGQRSIIAHAANPKVRDHINRCKGREMWRPLAPIVRAQDFTRFFDGPDSGEMSRFMLSTYRVKNPSLLPAVTHVDNTARAQMIEAGTIGAVLDALAELDEVPVVVNTSFNVAGEPLVETTEQAVSSFRKLGFDYLYIEGQIYK